MFEPQTIMAIEKYKNTVSVLAQPIFKGFLHILHHLSSDIIFRKHKSENNESTLLEQ